MVKINRLITPYNYTKLYNKSNLYVVIHYVGAVSSAKANANYFFKNKLQASANYFVDEKEIWQCVEDFNGAWHIGAKKYYNGARNNNSIGIEMCCKKDANGNWYIEADTIKNTIELTKYLMQKYNIKNLVTHNETTGKICPEPFVRNKNLWNDFKKKVFEENNTMEEELSFEEKCNKVSEYYGFDSNTMKFLCFYKFYAPLIEKLYKKIK